MRKLVRDKIPRLMLEEGLEPNVRILVGEKLETALRTKLLEEAGEVLVAPDQDNLLEELADVYAVLYALRKLHGWTMEDVQQVCRIKSSQKGGFAQGFEIDVPARPAPVFVLSRGQVKFA